MNNDIEFDLNKMEKAILSVKKVDIDDCFTPLTMRDKLSEKGNPLKVLRSVYKYHADFFKKNSKHPRFSAEHIQAITSYLTDSNITISTTNRIVSRLEALGHFVKFSDGTYGLNKHLFSNLNKNNDSAIKRTSSF